eukprot:CAMPEP_0170566690 /NCGR_PEP_ID=MMETSP0211-20121228/80000_1 /TAXON_ID=311385 /ORGANISM="Pseudokeronopsis sp., Strain OXSARD2" /LENGTH=86 /DNA_ID=CAMNT_0010887937 /DNA_START=347 /DNA_END=607 /DNA_ORIENTATION=+
MRNSNIEVRKELSQHQRIHSLNPSLNLPQTEATRKDEKSPEMFKEGRSTEHINYVEEEKKEEEKEGGIAKKKGRALFINKQFKEEN